MGPPLGVAGAKGGGFGLLCSLRRLGGGGVGYLAVRDGCGAEAPWLAIARRVAGGALLALPTVKSDCL